MRRSVLTAVTLLGVAVAAIGVWVSTGRRSASFGWTAYSPLSAEAYPVVVGPPWWAVALIAVGCLATGSAVTLLLVQRRRR